MQFLPLVTGIATGVYGLLYALMGSAQLRQKQIPALLAVLMLASGSLLVVAGAVLAAGTEYGLGMQVVGLLAIHAITLRNGYTLYGKINLRHHLFRLAISVVLITLAALSRLPAAPVG